jgi:hypothetical protein
MKLTQSPSDPVETVAQGAEGFQVIDRLGREVGALYYIQRQVYVEVADGSQSWSNAPCLTTPGVYFLATTCNTRNGECYASTTSVLCASQEAAQRYCNAYMTKKAKDAPKKAGK